jgi:hypothetical protein
MTAPSPRDWWLRYEVIHAVVYFDPECLAALDGLGFRGFWMGYFAGRAAPLGPIGPAPVTAAFFNFHPERARRSLPDAWTRARPTDVWATRTHAAAQVLRRVDPGVAATARALVPSLRALFNGVPDAGRPLFAATRATGEPDDPVESLWYWCSCLREHRGDGHVASLTAAGLDGCEALVLFAASEGLPVDLLRGSRGWSDLRPPEADPSWTARHRRDHAGGPRTSPLDRVDYGRPGRHGDRARAGGGGCSAVRRPDLRGGGRARRRGHRLSQSHGSARSRRRLTRPAGHRHPVLVPWNYRGQELIGVLLGDQHPLLRSRRQQSAEHRDLP